MLTQYLTTCFNFTCCWLSKPNSVTNVKSIALKDTFAKINEQSRSSEALRGMYAKRSIRRKHQLGFLTPIQNKSKCLDGWLFHKSKIWISPFISRRQAFKILVTDGVVTKLSVMIKVSNDFYVILHSLSSYCSPSCQKKWLAFPQSSQMPQCFKKKVIWAGATLLSACLWRTCGFRWQTFKMLVIAAGSPEWHVLLTAETWGPPRGSILSFLAVFYVHWQVESTTFTFSHSLTRNEW